MHIVEVEWTTDWDGRPIGPDERYARTFHGPFDTEAAAQQWVEDFPDFPELAEMLVIPLNPIEANDFYEDDEPIEDILAAMYRREEP